MLRLMVDELFRDKVSYIKVIQKIYSNYPLMGDPNMDNSELVSKRIIKTIDQHVFMVRLDQMGKFSMLPYLESLLTQVKFDIHI
jgi:hypothetical protein